MLFRKEKRKDSCLANSSFGVETMFRNKVILNLIPVFTMLKLESLVTKSMGTILPELAA